MKNKISKNSYNNPEHRRKIAFFVALAENLGPFSTSVDVVFDRVETNEGGIYKVETGRVTAPVTGTYQFTVVLSAQAMQKVIFTYKIN